MAVRVTTLARMAALIAAAVSIGAPASAEPALATVEQHAPETNALSLIAERLNSPGLAEREAASKALIALIIGTCDFGPRIFDHGLESAVVAAAQNESAPMETRARLMGALRDRFFRSPRAAMGVQFGGAQLQIGVQIQNTFENFPCHQQKLLLPEDILLAIDGVSLGSEALDPNHLGRVTLLAQSLILSRDPGDKVRLSVLRPGLAPNRDGQVEGPGILESKGQRIELLAPLGALTSLPGNPDAFQRVLESAWRVRLYRLGWADSSEISLKSTITPSVWSVHQSRPSPAIAERTISANDQPGSRENAAYHGDGGVVLVDGRAVRGQPMQALQAQVRLNAADGPGRVRQEVREELTRMNAIQEALIVITQQLQSLQDQLDRPGIPAALKATLTEQHAAVKDRGEDLQAELQGVFNRLQKQGGE